MGTMTETTAILFIIFGCFAIYCGCTAKQFYQIRSDRKIARSKGRISLSLVGSCSYFFGFKYFFYDVFH